MLVSVSKTTRRRLIHQGLLAPLLAGLLSAAAAVATVGDLVGPPGSGAFGASVTILSNGNLVVTDPFYDAGGTPDVGAVYLYHGGTRALISTLTGTRVYDGVGSGGVTALSNGNYVVSSPEWDNGGSTDAGAVTWGSGTGGVAGAVSAGNSLVGSAAFDWVGYGGVTALSNGNYVVNSPNWDNGDAQNAGAVTWGSGTSGVTGAVSAGNSLVGASAGDYIGNIGVTALSNGNYVVSSSRWQNSSIEKAGAVTWGDGTSGITGAVSAGNSLVGSAAFDIVGYGGVTALSNGNYVVSSPEWDNGSIENAGAVTWGDGARGSVGTPSTTPSILGAQANSGPTFTAPVFDPVSGAIVVGIPAEHRVAFLQAPAFTGGPPPTGRVGAPYRHRFTAAGSPAPTFALQTGGGLPAGLRLDPTGTLGGTPTAAGTFTFTVVAGNGISPPAERVVSVTIAARAWKAWLPLVAR